MTVERLLKNNSSNSEDGKVRGTSLRVLFDKNGRMHSGEASYILKMN